MPYVSGMRDIPRASLHEKLHESDALPEPDYDRWKRAKVERGLTEWRDTDRLIPAEQVWRDLGLET